MFFRCIWLCMMLFFPFCRSFKNGKKLIPNDSWKVVSRSTRKQDSQQNKKTMPGRAGGGNSQQWKWVWKRRVRFTGSGAGYIMFIVSRSKHWLPNAMLLVFFLSFFLRGTAFWIIQIRLWHISLYLFAIIVSVAIPMEYFVRLRWTYTISLNTS